MVNKLKRMTVLLFAVVMIFTFIPVLSGQAAYADDPPAELQGVSISAEGILTWDAYPGAEVYWVGVDGHFTTGEETGFDLNKYIDSLIEVSGLENSGSYSVRITAVGDGSTIAAWSGTYEYTSTAVPIVVGTLDNVYISESGILTWDAYPGTETYWIGVDGHYLTGLETGYDLNAHIDRLVTYGDIENNGSHTIKIEAANIKGQTIATWTGTYYYVSSAAPITVGTIENALVSSEGVLTWDAYPGTDKYWIVIEGHSESTIVTSYNLNSFIDKLITLGYIENTGSHTIIIEARNSSGYLIAESAGIEYSYTSSASTITVGEITNVSVSPEGILTWDAYPGTERYWVGVNGLYDSAKETSFDLNGFIDRLVKLNSLDNSGTYTVSIYSQNSDNYKIAEAPDFTYNYISSETPIIVGAIKNAKISSAGILTWDAYPGTSTYWVGVDGHYIPTDLTKYDLNVGINKLFLYGDIINSGTYEIKVQAADSGGFTIAEWIGTYEYVVPDQIPIDGAEVSGMALKKEYDGKAASINPMLDYYGFGMTKGTDYTVSYTDSKGETVTSMVNAGKYYIVFKGKGKFGGTKKVLFEITPKEITPKVSLSKKTYKWDGKEKTPTVTVKNGSKKMIKDTDYTVKLASGRKNVGKYSVKVTLKGNYSGTKTVYFTICPKGTSIKTLTSEKKAVTVSWKKQATNMSKKKITGYHIQLATDSKFTKNVKETEVKGYSTTSVKVKGLKAKKKYYVRIRTFRTISGTPYYSKWSKPKSVNTK